MEAKSLKCSRCGTPGTRPEPLTINLGDDYAVEEQPAVVAVLPSVSPVAGPPWRLLSVVGAGLLVLLVVVVAMGGML